MKLLYTERAWKNLNLAITLFHSAECKTVTGLWFRVHKPARLITVDNAVENSPSCRISRPIKLHEEEFELLTPYFVRWPTMILVAGVRLALSRKMSNTSLLSSIVMQAKPSSRIRLRFRTERQTADIEIASGHDKGALLAAERLCTTFDTINLPRFQCRLGSTSSNSGS